MTDLYFNVFLLKNKFSKIKRQNSVYIDKIIVKSNGVTTMLGLDKEL